MCELTHLGREPLDVRRASAEHQAYERCLAEFGVEVRHLRPAPDLPEVAQLQRELRPFDYEVRPAKAEAGVTCCSLLLRQ